VSAGSEIGDGGIVLYVTSLFGGMIFGLGLVISQMINPAKVLNFLDVAGHWDPTLALVFIGALAVAMPVYQWTLRNRSSPVAAPDFKLPESNAITPSLIGGSALFGIGWGLAGLCPGPALTALVTTLPGVLVFVVALFLGTACYRYLVGL
jgi:uncharacterized protein